MRRASMRACLSTLVILVLGLSCQATAWGALTPVFEYMPPGSGTGPAITDLSPSGNDGTVFPVLCSPHRPRSLPGPPPVRSRTT